MRPMKWVIDNWLQYRKFRRTKPLTRRAICFLDTNLLARSCKTKKNTEGPRISVLSSKVSPRGYEIHQTTSQSKFVPKRHIDLEIGAVNPYFPSGIWKSRFKALSLAGPNLGLCSGGRCSYVIKHEFGSPMRLNSPGISATNEMNLPLKFQRRGSAVACRYLYG